MSDITKRVHEVVTVQCQKCADDGVTFDYNPGGVGPSELAITCNACGHSTTINALSILTDVLESRQTSTAGCPQGDAGGSPQG